MRIVSLSPSNTEILCALGCEKELVGVTSLCDYPRELSVSRVSSWVDPDLREVTRLKPDLVFTSGFTQQSLADSLRKKGLSVFHVDPHSLKDVLSSFKEIGEVVGKRKEANSLVKEFKKKSVSKKLGKRVLCLQWLNPFMASGYWVPDLLKKAGCKSLLKSGEDSRVFSPEELKKFNPEAIIVSVCGAGAAVSAQSILDNEFFKNTDAVKKNKVFVIDDVLLNRPGPRLIESIIELDRALK
ncbi:MAG: cobalamin-binding protein [Candidatus Micrarchaeota archaeon]